MILSSLVWILFGIINIIILMIINRKSKKEKNFFFSPLFLLLSTEMNTIVSTSYNLSPLSFDEPYQFPRHFLPNVMKGNCYLYLFCTDDE